MVVRTTLSTSIAIHNFTNEQTDNLTQDFPTNFRCWSNHHTQQNSFNSSQLSAYPIITITITLPSLAHSLTLVFQRLSEREAFKKPQTYMYYIRTTEVVRGM